MLEIKRCHLVYLEFIYDVALHLLQLKFLGKDVLAKARTGTGKTVAFLVRLFICFCLSALVVNGLSVNHHYCTFLHNISFASVNQSKVE